MSPEARERSFDELARGMADGSISRRRALKLFIATALSSLVPARFAAATTEKVTICHKPGTPAEKTMDVPVSALRGHLGHGDTLGECGETTTTTTTSTTTTAAPTTTSTTTTAAPTTTSTTTTSSCLPNGTSCTEGSQCCSGNCKSGTCVAS